MTAPFVPLQFEYSGFAGVVQLAGVMGAGGGGFPLARKLLAKRDVVVINAGECEPLIHKDWAVLNATPQCVINGAVRIAQEVQASRIILALRETYAGLIPSFAAYAREHKVQIFQIPARYPMGYEKHLISYLFGQADAATMAQCCICNVETARNAAWASIDQPVRDKMVSIVGAVAQPTNFSAPIGSSFLDCLQAAGGATCTDYVVFDGGTLYGKRKPAEQIFVTPVSKGFVVLPAEHPLVQPGQDWQAAIQQKNLNQWFFGKDSAIFQGRFLPQAAVIAMLNLEPYCTAFKPAQKLPFPQRIQIQAPFSHPLLPCVSVGNAVKRGQTVALYRSFCPPHLPLNSGMDGTVISVSEQAIVIEHCH